MPLHEREVEKNRHFIMGTYVVGTQKNCLQETVLLSIHNKCKNDG